MGDKRWVTVLASVMVAGTGLAMLGQRRRRHDIAPTAVPTGSTDHDDVDDASGQLVPGPETNHTGHGNGYIINNNNGQPGEAIWCEVAADNPDDLDGAAKAPPEKEWSIVQDEKIVNGRTLYLVHNPLTQITRWLRMDEITFMDAHGHNLRPRVRNEA